MSFFLEKNESFKFKEIDRQFSAFLTHQDKLPICRICFNERKEKLLEKAVLTKRLGQHSIYSLDGSIMVANHSYFAVVNTSFDGIDVYLPAAKVYPERQIAFLILQAYRFIVAHHGHLQIHSAVVTCKGEGVAFCGLSGAGKSTQAHLWEEYKGAEALNLDQPCIIFEDGAPLISGTPWSGKEDCYKTEAVPLRAVIFVEQSPCNELERMSPAVAFSTLYLNNYLLPVSKELDARHKGAIEALVKSVPVYTLKCTVSENAVNTVYNELFADK